jgi:hypothetical protein
MVQIAADASLALVGGDTEQIPWKMVSREQEEHRRGFRYI